MTDKQQFQCWFCGGTSSKNLYSGIFHEFKKDFGPFVIEKCLECGSLITHPAPTPKMLADFYAVYHLYRGDAYDENQEAGTINTFYDSCFDRLKRNIPFNSGDEFIWFDVGSGNGQLIERMARQYPNAQGTAFDIAPARPSWMPENVRYRGIDQNNPNFADVIGEQADVVYNNIVLEHVLRPDQYLENLVKLTKPGGLAYVVCPNSGSLLSHILGRKWPYFMPGEHVNIPTIPGMEKCLASQMKKIKSRGPVRLDVRVIWFKYSIKYIFNRFGMKFLAKFIPKGLALAFPYGALEASIRIPPDSPSQIGT